MDSENLISAAPQRDYTVVSAAADTGSSSVMRIASSQAANRPSSTTLDRTEVASSLFDAFNRRDLAATLKLVHPEIVFQPVSAAVMSAGEPYRGHEGIHRYLRDLETYWLELTVHPSQIRAAGQAVVALGRVSGRGVAGMIDEAPATWVLKFRDGLVVHAQVFAEERTMRQALGA